MHAIQRKMADLGDECLADMDTAGIDVQVLSLSGILLDTLDSATADLPWTIHLAGTTPGAFLHFLPVSAMDKEKIAHGNAERLLER